MKSSVLFPLALVLTDDQGNFLRREIIYSAVELDAYDWEQHIHYEIVFLAGNSRLRQMTAVTLIIATLCAVALYFDLRDGHGLPAAMMIVAVAFNLFAAGYTIHALRKRYILN